MDYIYYLCQDCLNVVRSEKVEDWEKYHQTEGSCPVCGGDMCGCPSCHREGMLLYEEREC